MPAHLVPDFALITDEMTARLGNEAALRIEQVTVGFTAKRGEPIKERRLVAGPFRCVIQAEGGHVVEFGTGPELCMVQRMVAEDMVIELNRQLHHDGCWLFNFATPEPKPAVVVETGRRYGRFAILWMDADGDIQFAIDCERAFEKTIEEGPAALAEKCERAFTWWRWQRGLLEIRPGETFKKALGEQAPSATRH
jgi:hypothetical protein